MARFPRPTVMTTLFVVQDAPYPPRSGSPMRAWQNINLLASLGPVHVFSVGIRESDAAMPVAASWTHVDAADFPVRSNDGFSRFLRLVAPREFPVEDDYAGPRINKLLAELRMRVRPDLIVVSHWHTALPRALRGKGPLVADFHNVESTLAATLWASEPGGLTARRRYQLSQWRRRERALLRAADVVWATSADDAVALRELIGRRKARSARAGTFAILPNAVDVDAYAGVRRDRELRTAVSPTIFYVGFYGYPPNADAAAALADEIFPRIAEAFPEARLLLVGKAPSDRMQRAAERDPRIVVTGAVDDVRDYLREADLLVVPLLAGSGTRLKILEAFAAAIPVVSTPKGAQGIAAVPGTHLEVCDVAEMAERCVALLRDEQRRAALVRAALDLVERKYSWTALAGEVDALLPGDLRSKLPSRGR